LGPTASGKSELAVKLAKKYGGEIVSADSRQVYKKLDIGSGKITKKEMEGIRHWLLDVASPKRKFSVAQYQKLALRAIKKILKKNKLPFLVGGSPFYIKSITDQPALPPIKPDWQLRKKLEKLPTINLFKKLQALDAERASKIDKNNRRRLIRALEIVIKTGKPVPALTNKKNLPFEILKIGIKRSAQELEKRIKERLMKRLEHDALIKEVKNLRKEGLSFKRLEELGLEYRFVAQYLQNKISRREMEEKIIKASKKLVRNQMNWFKKDKEIKWIKNYRQAQQLINQFLAQK